MAFLLNRTAAARLECLHALAKLIKSKFGLNKTFSLSDVKFDRNEENIHEYCTLLSSNELIGKYCPFKENPLDEAGCSITNGKTSDSTKSKEVSNTINALHAIGVIERDGRKCKLTPLGSDFASLDYASPEMTDLLKQLVLNYGPVIGVIDQIRTTANNGKFNIGNVEVGYPNPNESIEFNGKHISLSDGSKTDSNTRTKSCIIAWLTTAGYIKPSHIKPKGYLPQLAYREYINRGQRSEQEYEIIELPDATNVLRPLDYVNLTKGTKNLRENDIAEVREATLYYEPIIRNRRLAIIYLLNEAYKTKKDLSLSKFINFLRKHPKLFVVSEGTLEDTINTEIEIAYMAGLPYAIVYKGDEIYLRPIQGVNIDELLIGAPKEVTETIKKFNFNG